MTVLSVPLPYSSCQRRQCVICFVHDTLESDGAASVPNGSLREAQCRTTVQFAKRTSCAAILKLDEEQATYRRTGAAADLGRMCDFGVLTRIGSGNSVAVIELKSRTLPTTLVDQLQAGLDLLSGLFTQASATASARALLVTAHSVAHAKRFLQAKPGFLQKSASLSCNGIQVRLEFAKSGDVIHC